MKRGFLAAALAAETGSLNMSHLESIATRQRQGRLRDVLFVAIVAIAAVVSTSTVSQAVHASSIVAHR